MDQCTLLSALLSISLTHLPYIFLLTAHDLLKIKVKFDIVYNL